jgi:dTDP-glucose 4,6-dehydratase
MRLLVTGGAGFIGSNFIRHIIDQPQIEELVNLDALTYAGNLDNLGNISERPQYHFAHIDIRNAPAVRDLFEARQPTHVVHLAAESHVDRSISGPDDFIQTNIVGTFNLLEAARTIWSDNTVQHQFLHVSTDEVYGSLAPGGLFTEESPLAPNSPYSASKAASDMLVRAYFHTYKLPVVTTNCSNNYGPFQYPEKLIPVVIHSILERKPIPVYGDGKNVRDWLYVEDHAQALWQVLLEGRVGETYCIGGCNEIANLELVERICDCVDVLRPELGGNSRSLISYVRDRPGHDRRYAINPRKIIEELGWKPKVSFEQGLDATVRWYLRE